MAWSISIWPVAEAEAAANGDYSATVENYRRAKEIFAKHLDEEDRTCYRSACCAIGNLLNKPDTAAQANKEYNDAVESDLKDNLRGREDLMVHATALANNYALLGNSNEAEKWYKLALDDGEQRKANPFLLGRATKEVADFYVARGDLPNAIALLKKATTLLSQTTTLAWQREAKPLNVETIKELDGLTRQAKDHRKQL